ncbi:SWIM zinc finger family protein [Natronospora cellulosivora (SeqCode)]
MTFLTTAKKDGLLPLPKKIEFDCSCPDYASMCKHIATVLYGVGTKLDQDPTLFFTLRNLDFDDLITKAIKQKSESLLKKI